MTKPFAAPTPARAWLSSLSRWITALWIYPTSTPPGQRGHREAAPLPDEGDVRAAVKLIEKAERPVLYVGQGIRGAADEAVALAKHDSMPIVTSVLAKGIIPDSEERLMGTAARVASKPANEALALADLVLFVGSDFPFARFFFPGDAKMIQVDVDSAKLGRRHPVDAAILADAGATMRSLREAGVKREETAFAKACVKNRANWQKWLAGFTDRDDIPLRPEPVFQEINRIADDDAIFVTDVGNSTIRAVRLLDMNGREQRFTHPECLRPWVMAYPAA